MSSITLVDNYCPLNKQDVGVPSLRIGDSCDLDWRGKTIQVLIYSVQLGKLAHLCSVRTRMKIKFSLFGNIKKVTVRNCTFTINVSENNC